MKRFVFIFSLLGLGACTAQNRAAFVRTYNLHPFNRVEPEEAAQRLRANPAYYVLIDLQKPEDFNRAHLGGALNYPSSSGAAMEELRLKLRTSFAGKSLLIYSQNGQYPYRLRRLAFANPRIKFLNFGFRQWTGPMEGEDTAEILIQNRNRADAYRL